MEVQPRPVKTKARQWRASWDFLGGPANFQLPKVFFLEALKSILGGPFKGLPNKATKNVPSLELT